MADIQAMYYEVKVSESQRSYIRYLWWKESDINAEIVDHEMCVHLFGAVSSPSSSKTLLVKRLLLTTVVLLVQMFQKQL